MIQASARRRTREANYFCSQCGNSFTTENSRKRVFCSISIGLDGKFLTRLIFHRSRIALTVARRHTSCSFTGCGQTFSNDDDRKRHENKSKKHARS
jgi:hypothetical protein